MTNAALRGVSDAGNPHVAPSQCYGGTSRFDGRIERATPRRWSLLYKHVHKFAAFVAAAFNLVLMASAVDLTGMTNGTTLTVPENTVLSLTTVADILKLADFTAISIPATSEIVCNCNDHSAELNLSAGLSGGGRISFLRFKSVFMSGDNTSFTGEFFSSNTTVTVASPASLGASSRVTHYLGKFWYSNYNFHSAYRLGSGTYTNEFHFHGETGSRAVSHATNHGTTQDTSATIEFAGALHLHGDVAFHRNGATMRFNCPVTLHDPVYSTADARLAVTRISCAQAQKFDFGDGYICVADRGSAIAGDYTCGRFVVSGGEFTIYYGGNVVFNPTASLQFTADFKEDNGTPSDATLYRGSLTWDGSASNVHSFSNLLYRDGIDASNLHQTDNTLKMSGTLRVTGCGPACGWYVKCVDYDATHQMSIEIDSQTETPGELTLLNPSSTMTGTLSAKRGRLVVGEGARFSGVTKLQASGEGVIEIQDVEAFTSGPVTLEFAGPESGAISIPTGKTFVVDKVLVNGKEMLVGDYFGAAGSGAFQVLGGGTLRVSNSATTCTEKYWTGAAGDGDFSNRSNWSYNQMPTGDGTEKLVLYDGHISANDTGVINIDREVRFCGLSVNVKKSFTFNGSGSGRIIFCPNGTGDAEIGQGPDFDKPDGVSAYANIVLQHRDTTSGIQNVYTFNLPVSFAPGYDRNIACGSLVKARFLGRISGGDATHQIGLYWYKFGQTSIEFGGDNVDWLSPLRAKNIYDLVVSSSTGLGGPNRKSEVKNWGEYRLRFIGDGLTNNTPLKIWIGDGHGGDNSGVVVSNTMWTASFEDPFVQVAPLHLVGNRNTMFFVGGWDFQGGIIAERDSSVTDDDNVQLYIRNANSLRVGGPLLFPSSLLGVRSACSSDLYLGGTGSVVKTLWLMNVWANCEREGVLSKDMPCRIGTLAWNGGGFKLNGADQDLQSILIDDYVEITENTSVSLYGSTVESDTPATLTLWPTSTLPAAIVRFRDRASLTLNGTVDSSVTLVNGFSDTDGKLTVNGGTLVFKWGAGWGGTNVVLNAGTLRVSERAGDSAFGTDGRRADVLMAYGARLEVDAGERAVVGAVTVDGRSLMCGRWGGPCCTAVAPDHRISAFAGEGVVRVTKGERSGMILFVR